MAAEVQADVGVGVEPESEARPLIEPTGTWWDQFIPVYASMAIPGVLRRGYSSMEVDAMPIPLVGELFRLGPAPKTIEDEAHDMLRRRMEAASAGLPEPEW